MKYSRSSSSLTPKPTLSLTQKFVFLCVQLILSLLRRTHISNACLRLSSSFLCVKDSLLIAILSNAPNKEVHKYLLTVNTNIITFTTNKSINQYAIIIRFTIIKITTILVLIIILYLRGNRMVDDMYGRCLVVFFVCYLGIRKYRNRSATPVTAYGSTIAVLPHQLQR